MSDFWLCQISPTLLESYFFSDIPFLAPQWAVRSDECVLPVFVFLFATR
jgi:hypothetical protein